MMGLQKKKYTVASPLNIKLEMAWYLTTTKTISIQWTFDTPHKSEFISDGIPSGNGLPKDKGFRTYGSDMLKNICQGGVSKY